MTVASDERPGTHLVRLPLAHHSGALRIGHAVTPESLGEVSGWLTARLDERATA
jgi:hypothetical protein